MIAAAYARVSTTDQDNSIQITELTEYAAARRWKCEVFQDQMTGGTNDRPGLNALMDGARRRLIDVVLVLKLDRFGRSTLDILSNIAELKALGVRFIATAQGLDTDQSNPVSNFLLTILGAVAELEREMIGERVRAGILRAKQKGVKFGRKQVVFNRGLAYEMRDAGSSIREIGAALGVGAGTIARLLAAVPKLPLDEPPAGSMKTKRQKRRKNGPKG
jgi:DNA invertase Pin-like site-specific DNA recombinase